MGLFSKSIPDELWRNQIEPAFERATAVIGELWRSSDGESLEEQAEAVHKPSCNCRRWRLR